MGLHKYILVLCAIQAGLVWSAAQPHETLWKPIRARRDEVLKKSNTQRLSMNETVKLFLPVFKDAFEKGVIERRALLAADPNHYSHHINATQCIRAQIVEIMKSNQLYAARNPAEIGALDISRVDFSRFYRGTAPLFLMYVHGNALLKKMCPGAKAVICFDPRAVLTQGELESFVGHELAHSTQKSLGGSCGRYFAEIDADIKNLCILGKDGLWRLRDHIEQFIIDCFGLLAQEDIYAIEQLTIDLEDTKKDEVAALCDAVLPVYRSTHPTFQDRIGYMQEVAALIQDVGGTISNDEFRAMINIITARLCTARNFKIDAGFLKFVDLEQARTLPRIVARMQIPTQYQSSCFAPL